MLAALILAAAQVEVSVEPIDSPRRYAVAEWTVPAECKPPFLLTEKKSGQSVPCQSEGQSLRWLISDLPAHEGRSYVVAHTDKVGLPSMTISEDLAVRSPEREITRYVIDEKFGKPSFYPLLSREVALTRAYPIEKKKGESTDHPHHVSLWFAHGDVNGHDYWAKLPIRHTRFAEKSAGPLYARIVSENAWGEEVTETREVLIYNVGEDLLMDWTIRLSTQKDSVKFGRTKEGGFAIRVAEGLTEKMGGKMVTADGRKGEAECRSKPAPWCDFYGEVNSKKVGIAILAHPESFRAPVDWHVRGYGLLAANPFLVQGDHTLKKGESLTFRYRVYAHAGDAAEGRVAEVYEAYAHPPHVSQAK